MHQRHMCNECLQAPNHTVCCPDLALCAVGLSHARSAGNCCMQVSCGSRHTVALTATGRVFAWGLNKHGQCCTAAGTGVAKRAAAEAAAAATTASALTWDTSFEVQTITAPRPVDLRNTVICPFFHPQGSVAAMEGSELAGHRDARKLAECGKVIAVRAGRWHTMVEFCLLIS
jgi:hypothetical protein